MYSLETIAYGVSVGLGFAAAFPFAFALALAALRLAALIFDKMPAADALTQANCEDFYLKSWGHEQSKLPFGIGLVRVESHVRTNHFGSSLVTCQSLGS